jgi:PleD family two-component response regulator
MVLAVVDDLMFTSKIRSAANAAGATVAFARSRQAALEQMRQTPPALVILDLDSPRTDPIGTVVAMKADVALAAIPTLGFVSHVHAELIGRARDAGVGDVLARSAFSASLPEIMKRAGAAATTPPPQQ